MATTHISKCCSVITALVIFKATARRRQPAQLHGIRRVGVPIICVVDPATLQAILYKVHYVVEVLIESRIVGRVVPLQRANQIRLNLFLILNTITIIRLTGIPRLTRSSALANAYPIAAISSTMTRNITAKYCTTA